MTLAARLLPSSTDLLPRDELDGLTAQIRRAAVSIPANIAEGHSRRSRGAYRYHVSVALGSHAELGHSVARPGARALSGYREPAAMADCQCQDVVRVGMMLHALAPVRSKRLHADPSDPRAADPRPPTRRI